MGWLWLGLGLSGVAMLSATAGALLAVSLSSTPLMQSRIRPEDHGIFSDEDLAISNMRIPELTRPVNILVLGTKVLNSDVGKPLRRSGHDPLVNSLDGLSDSMMLVRFEPQDKNLTLLSVPRDTLTWIDGYGDQKINEANHHGGPALSARTVSDLLGGVGIDRYLRVNIQGVEKLIDVLGGVRVNVPQDMKYTDHTQHLYIDLKAGEQHLNGNEALQFLTFRHDGMGDIGRIQRQQMLLRALIEQTLNPRTLVRLPRILSTIQEYVDTNLSVEELVALLNFASQTSRENAQMLLLPGQFRDPQTPEDLSYWIPNYAEIDHMVAEHFGRSSEPTQAWRADPRYLRIAIQDSTEEPEAVDALIDKLWDAGYRNVYLAHDWQQPLRETRIIAQGGDRNSALDVNRSLGLGEVRVESTGVLHSDITIQLGQDWLEKQSSHPQSDLW
ncbi:LytR family transcriptional regulator [Geitlerinema sp. P-1104]|uniref:LCP family protein n=1 Tax=Geitlerinema sp. P-1104 TaxID=2546230 RepID=UPI0016A9BC27|nr:LCP family protein [Geitlerinema sp. P-1104]NMG58048.1 LytR family transcriptional regulator [Geitlerinema sp. P-1104]